MSELSEYLGRAKKRFLLARGEAGGKAVDFRNEIAAQYGKDRAFFDSLVLDALLEAASKKWEAQPRKRGPDLFSVNGYVIPEYLTRPVYETDEEDQDADHDDNDDDDDDETPTDYEKVDATFASIQDLLEDTLLKFRKAAQSSAAAEKQMKAVVELRKRAKGDLRMALKDVVDIVAPNRKRA